MSYESSARRCNQMLALAKAGATVWWRRGGFHEEPFRDTDPKWHVLTGRLSHRNTPNMLPLQEPVWLALCGYKKSFSEQIFHTFPRLTKNAPKKVTRCLRCLDELPEYKKQVADRLAKEAKKTEQDAADQTPVPLVNPITESDEGFIEVVPRP